MDTTDKVRLSPAMREVLELEDEEPIAGNIMARAVNVTMGGGFTGMELGWADEDSAALAFVVGLVETADEETADDWCEYADAAVPIYTEEIWRVAKRLRDLVDDEEATELAGDGDLTQRLQVGLYTVARQILEGLARELENVRADA